MFECECGKKLSNKSGYVTHRKYCDDTDVEVEAYRCSCGKEFKQEGGLINHEKWCSESDRSPDERDYINCNLCDQKIESRNLKRHKNSKRCKREQFKKKRIENEKVCENCEENIVKDFGDDSTGRFCSEKCARSYATREIREEINERVSETLSERITGPNRKLSEYEKEGWFKECPICEEKFYVTESNKDKTFCSRKCYSKDLGEYNHMEVAGGYRENSTIKHSCEYKQQKMDSGAELKFAKLLDENNINWNKNEQDTFFRYEGVNGKERKYYPDFYLENYGFWVEIKSEYYQTQNLDRKIESVPNIQLVYIDEIKDFIES